MSLLSSERHKRTENYFHQERLAQRLKSVKMENINPKNFKKGDIVYLAWSPRHGADKNWPCIGSEWECDLKILDINGEMASLISGASIHIRSELRYLVEPKDKVLYRHENIFISNVETELFPEKTYFFLSVDGYYCNEDLDIYIHRDRMPEKTLTQVRNKNQ